MRGLGQTGDVFGVLHRHDGVALVGNHAGAEPPHIRPPSFSVDVGGDAVDRLAERVFVRLVRVVEQVPAVIGNEQPRCAQRPKGNDAVSAERFKLGGNRERNGHFHDQRVVPFHFEKAPTRLASASGEHLAVAAVGEKGGVSAALTVLEVGFTLHCARTIIYHRKWPAGWRRVRIVWSELGVGRSTSCRPFRLL